ncbi:NAD(P)H-dependent oxidoreductase [Breoghania sp.]|uniref:NAD(P)H-dependent oxidoreductase n=1 Tax=Breoghania sp. TaxID=2065378 RepID=UPI002AAB46E4|nr:NAD(P)H-dependent oxidoreductase [Breoghania sp.]
MKRIFVLDGHPCVATLSHHLATSYAEAAEAAGHEVRMLNLSALSFDIDQQSNYRDLKPLEPDLAAVIDNLEWADHIVISTPMWWGGLPARLKGLLDRALLPGRAFSTRETTALGMPKPMLAGRTARMIVTSDTPGWFFRLIYKSALVVQMKRQVFDLIGLKPSRFTLLAGASHPKPGVVQRWLEKAAALGRKAI